MKIEQKLILDLDADTPVICNQSGCTKKASHEFGGLFYCLVHWNSCQILKGLEGLQIGDDGSPTDKKWLNSFACLAGELMWDDTSISKAKIENRATEFAVEGSTVMFSIVRHPVGRNIRERWAFDLATLQWQKVGEELLKCRYKQSQHGNYFLCPDCWGALDVTPGRAKCTNWECDFVDYHEHSL
jgi:hypothetical protein